MNQNQNSSKFIIYYPIFLAVMLVIGIYIGSFFTEPSGGGSVMISRKINSPADKIVQIINYIEDQYVDSVTKNALVDKAIAAILEDLDPHSYYISAEELAGYTEPLEGNFEGIGVEFLIQDDTVRVVAAVEGGPSEQLGIQAGDKIIAVDGDTIAGVGIANEDVIRRLKGPSETKVKVDILRRNQTLPFEITRGKIPLNSVATGQMLNDKTGFIKVSRFARTTYDEFMSHAESLEQQGMKRLIIDLRGNGGGYLDAAVKLSEEFLQKGQLVVYTEGKSSPRRSYYARKLGKYAGIPVVVLINQGSASASEIFAGAIQDNDRGTIIGRRSFGKGLVQEHLNLRDNSALRLTVARYYTPTGRSIQKPYGAEVDYESDFEDRYLSGELESADSIPLPDSLVYTTPGGRIVYGGGGITPDIFVGLDTVGASEYLSIVSYRGIINQFGFDYADHNRTSLNAYHGYEEFNNRFSIDSGIFDAFVNYAKDKGVSPEVQGLKRSAVVLETRLKAYIARNIWGNDGFYAVMADDDNVLKVAMEAISAEEQNVPSNRTTQVLR
jgi:carboxyl-terminal processing protease